MHHPSGVYSRYYAPFRLQAPALFNKACRDGKKVSLCILQMISRLIIIDITNVSNRLYLLIKCKLYIFPGLLSGTKSGSGAKQTRTGGEAYLNLQRGFSGNRKSVTILSLLDYASLFCLGTAIKRIEQCSI